MSILPLSEITRVPEDRGVTSSRFLQSIASGPSGHLSPAERRQRREAIRSRRGQSDSSLLRAPTLLLFERAFPHRLTTRVNGRWSRALSRLLAASLDRKLAEGRSPESHLLLAARAQVLASPVERQMLAHQWTDLLARARTPPGLRSPRASINRTGIAANEPAIRALLTTLVAPMPGHARGIATLSWLLSDGTGPLYDPRRSAELRQALEEATALLESSGI
jgi:hypothetical protein